MNSKLQRFWVSGLAFAAMAGLAGCGRAKVMTEIRPDGSFTRTVSLTGQEKKEGMQMSPSLDDVFGAPAGTEWKKTEAKKSEEVTNTYTRTVAAGGSLKGDLTLKAGEGKIQLANEVTVTRNGKRVEYKETLHWSGDKPPDFGTIKKEDLAEVVAALPKPLATDANARMLAERAATLLVPMMFGPGDPLLALGILHPDLAERRATQKIGTLMVKVLEDQFGDKMKPEERRQVAVKLIEKGFSSAKPSQPDPSAGPPSTGKNGAPLVPLMFVLKAPGKVVSTNGQIDEFTGEVYWALFGEAAVLKDVVLTAVFEN